MPPTQREAVKKAILKLSEKEQEELLFLWTFWARQNQLPPDDFAIWLVQAGRGFGKTRIGAEFARWNAEKYPGSRGALVGATAADTRDVMVEGESGILAISPPWFMPVYEPSKRRLTWPNGSRATMYSADEPQRLRGPQHHWGWGDELAAWRYAEAVTQLKFGMRLPYKGDPNYRPKTVVTSTPAVTEAFKELLRQPGLVITRGSMQDNIANLAPDFIETVLARYQGTRLGRQEIDGELLEDNPHALWRRDWIDQMRLGADASPKIVRSVVAIDPATTTGENADETGIVVAGVDARGKGYVMADASGHHTPEEWAKTAIHLYRLFKCNSIVAEANNGGEMIIRTIHAIDPHVPVKLVWASQGKERRAEPVAMLYEQRRVHHVGILSKLEDQMCDFQPGLIDSRGRKVKQSSPDRMDALVWALTFLMLETNKQSAYGFDVG